MDVDKTPNPEPTTQLPEAPKLDLTRNDESVMRDVKAWASWKSPRIPAGSQKDGHVALSQRSWRRAPHPRLLSADYEGDPLDQIVRFCLLLDSTIVLNLFVGTISFSA